MLLKMQPGNRTFDKREREFRITILDAKSRVLMRIQILAFFEIDFLSIDYFFTRRFISRCRPRLTYVLWHAFFLFCCRYCLILGSFFFEKRTWTSCCLFLLDCDLPFLRILSLEVGKEFLEGPSVGHSPYMCYLYYANLPQSCFKWACVCPLLRLSFCSNSFALFHFFTFETAFLAHCVADSCRFPNLLVQNLIQSTH